MVTCTTKYLTPYLGGAHFETSIYSADHTYDGSIIAKKVEGTSLKFKRNDDLNISFRQNKVCTFKYIKRFHGIFIFIYLCTRMCAIIDLGCHCMQGSARENERKSNFSDHSRTGVIIFGCIVVLTSRAEGFTCRSVLIGR